MTGTLPALLPGGTFRSGRFSLRVWPRDLIVIAVVVVVLAGLTTLTLMTGSMPLAPDELLAVFSGTADPAPTRSVLGRRRPRALTAALVGCCLGLSGAVFQSVSRNPLGSPDIIGFTSGAATGAIVQILVFGGGILATAAAALCGGIVTALVVYVLARRHGTSGGVRLVLVGIGVGSVLSAVTSLLVVRAEITDATTVQLWSSGSLIGRGWPHVTALLCGLVILVPVLVLIAGKVSALELGDDTAHSLGLHPERIRLIALLIGVVLAAIATAAAGPIAFIAFAAPQIARRLSRSSGLHLGLSAVLGATLLVLADLIATTVDVGLRTPVGLVTSLLGGLYLLWLLARRL
ncbi:MAG: FecCD family ABC transporter permease [Mycetocola sp.]